MLWGLLVLLLLALVSSSFQSNSSLVIKSAPKAKQGVIDLTKWNFQQNGNIALSGEWEFYWNQFLSHDDFKIHQEPTAYLKSPGIWNSITVDKKKLSGFGYGTYRLKVRIPNQKELLGLHVKTLATAYQLYINNKKVLWNGTIARTSLGHVPQYLPKTASFQSDQKEFYIIVHVSNFSHYQGGMWISLKLGAAKNIFSTRGKQLAFDLFLFGSLFIMGLYHFGLFALRNKDLSSLYFGGFCLAVGIRTLLTGETYFIFLFPDFNWDLQIKLEYLSFYLPPAFFVLFFKQLYPEEVNKWYTRIVLVVSIAFSMVVLVTSVAIFSKTVQVFQLFSLLFLSYLMFALGLAIKKKREAAWIVFLGFSLFFGTVINDILYRNEVITSTELASFGLFIFIFSQSFILSMKFSKAFTTVELLVKEIEKKNEAFRRFVPEEFLGLLDKKSIIDVSLGDNVEMSMSILFTDIREFTTLSETMTPEENFKFLNSYLQRMEPIINENKGFIDKYIGDAIMALFQSSADHAVKTAVDMMKALRDYNANRKIYYGTPDIKIGIGINTGRVMLGTIGGYNRMEGTVISDAVNLAARLESLTKAYTSSVLISEYTYRELEDPSIYYIRKIDKVAVKGKSKAVTIYEIFEGDDDDIKYKKNKYIPLLEKGIQAYLKGSFQESLDTFQEYQELFPRDPVIPIYLKRCQEMIEIGCPSDWDGVVRLKQK
ncbi:MAG: adenylate cyclase [bacterium]|jgi:adenylate cyclase